MQPAVVEKDNQAIPYEELVAILQKPNRSAEDDKKLSTYFNGIKFFADCKAILKPEPYKRILKAITFESVSKNKYLFHKGDRGNKFYVVLKGHTNVVIPRPTGAVLKPNKPMQKHITKVLQYLAKLANLGSSSPVATTDQKKNDSLGVGDMTKRSFPNKRRGMELNVNQLAAAVNEAQKAVTDGDAEAKETERLKVKFDEIQQMTHPVMKITKAKTILGFAFVKHWLDKLKPKKDDPENDTSALRKLDHRAFMPFRMKIYWHNTFLFGLRNMDVEFLTYLLPGQMKVHQYGVGGYFGEIAILGNGLRAAGIYCDEDSDFAVISKKYENDFLFLYKAQNQDKENALKAFSAFNWWIQRDKIRGLFHYMKQISKPLGSPIYQKGRLAG